MAALARHEVAPARLALGDAQDPLASLIRLLLLGDPVALADVRRLLPVEQLTRLLDVDGDQVRCAIEVAPHGDDHADWWVLSDRTDRRGRPQRRDHVLGVGGASTTLAQLTVRRPVARSLDIGTGCGVQALHLSRHSESVTATDTVARALHFAATGFALAGVDVEVVEGDLAQPVGGREFDLVVCNPPFVVGPSARFAYRDAGRDGDALSRDAVRSAASVLAPDGVAQLLVNWLHVRGEDWRDRVASWVSDLGCDAWLIERDAQVPADYVSTWSSDAGDDDEAVASEWLRWLQSRDVEAIGFGWVVLRRGAAPHRVSVEAAAQPVEQPLGPHVAAWLDRVQWLRDHDDDERLLAAVLRAAPTLRHDVTSAADPGTGWRTAGQALRLQDGFRWSLPCDDATSSLAAACDGSRPVRAVAAVLAAVLGQPDAEVAAAVCATARGLLDRGFLLP